MATPAHLRLERSKANLLFSSWRLSSSIAREQGALPLPSPAAVPTAADTDYVVARHAALLNALAAQPSGAFTCFLEGGAGGGEGSTQLALYQLDLGEPQHPPALRRLCGLPPSHEADVSGLSTGPLPPSAVEVQAAGVPSGLMLVSAGHGDVALALQQPRQQQPAGAAALSPAVWPLRPAPPLQGVRPVHLAAAFALPPQAGGAAPSGGEQQAAVDVCCILWAPRPRSERQASRCEVYAVRLAASLAPHPALAVRSVQLLKVSDLPPHGVLANPATGGVLLALQPAAGSEEEEAAAQRAAAAAAPQQPAGGTGGGGDDDDDDVSPRSLAAAVARLQAYTSEEPVGALPHQQYADLYREAGADGVGAMGSEPTCTLFTFAPAAAGGGADAAAAQAAAAAGEPLLRLVHTLSCQPHKLLTCHLQPLAFGAQEPPTPDTHVAAGGDGSGGQAAGAGPAGTPGGGQAAAGPTLLLGLTDDVDCAVVAISCADAGAAGAGSVDAAPEGCQGGAGFVVRHAASIPALAYVAAGKVQRKFVLLAPPGGDLAGALAEASKYCYLYRATERRQEYGEHQVVDMELPDGSGRGLLGAALAGGRAGGTRLVLLAREGLRVIDI